MDANRTALNRQSGQTLLLFGLAAGVLLLCLMAVIDVGFFLHERQNAQKAADAAALAAAGVLANTGDPDAAEDAGYKWSESNGYDNLDDVDVNVPPLSGDHAGDGRFVEVVIRTKSGLYFGGLVGETIWSTQGRAVGTFTDAYRALGMIALDPSACDSFHVNGGADIQLTGSSIFINSDCDPAATGVGPANITASAIEIVGNWDFADGVTLSPPPTRSSSITDPYSGIAEPAPPSGPSRPCPNFGGNGNTVLQPGVYDCTIDPPGGRSVTFQAGDYLLNGGLVANGSGSTVMNGPGVYTFRGQGLKVTGTGDFTVNGATLFIDQGELVLTGTGNTTITASTSGPLAGVAVFQARDNEKAVKLAGTALSGGTGIVYTPSALIEYQGTADGVGMQLVANKFEIAGNSRIEIGPVEVVKIGPERIRLVE